MKQKILYAIIILIVITSGALVVNTYFMNDGERNPDNDGMENTNTENSDMSNSEEDMTEESDTQENVTLEDINLANYNGIQKSSESLTIKPEKLINSHISAISELNSSTMLLNSLNSSRRVMLEGDKYQIEERDSDYESVRYSDGFYEYERIGNTIDGTYYQVSEYNDSNNHRDIYPKNRARTLLEESEVVGYTVRNRRITLKLNNTDEDKMEDLLNVSSLQSYELNITVNSNNVIEDFAVSYTEIVNGRVISGGEVYRFDRTENTEVTSPQWLNKAQAFDGPIRISIEGQKIIVTKTVDGDRLQNSTISVLYEGDNRTRTVTEQLGSDFAGVEEVYVTNISENLTTTTDVTTVGSINTDKVNDVIVEDSISQYSYTQQGTQGPNPYEQKEETIEPGPM